MKRGGGGGRVLWRRAVDELLMLLCDKIANKQNSKKQEVLGWIFQARSLFLQVLLYMPCSRAPWQWPVGAQ